LKRTPPAGAQARRFTVIVGILDVHLWNGAGLGVYIAKNNKTETPTIANTGRSLTIPVRL
jgi:hypothetical protein